MYICKNCQYQSLKWQGKCPTCSSWNSLEESNSGAHERRGGTEKIQPVNSLSDLQEHTQKRILTGSRELNAVLGGGILPQSVILISGEPGIGKSTLLLRIAAEIRSRSVLYISAEESLSQVRMRAERMSIENNTLMLSEEHYIENIEQHIQSLKPELLILDSIQSLRTNLQDIGSGEITQLRSCITSCYKWSHTYGCAIIMVAHVTKNGAIAGPKLIEHLVDVVLVLEQNKDRLRFLYSRKNRFGTVDEVGIFKMTEKSMEDVLNTGAFFLEERKDSWPPGLTVTCTYEGTRPFLVEIQALTVPVFSNNRVFSEIINSNQVFRIAAILERHAGVTLSNQNIYINTAGGIRIHESGIELAIALSLYSAYQNNPLPVNCCAIGELSLTGEIRTVFNFMQRIKQIKDTGIKKVLVPRRNLAEISQQPANLLLIPVKNIQEAILAVKKHNIL